MRADDRHNASQLRDRLGRAGGTEWVELAALRTWFGGKRLSTARRHQIAAALAAARIDVYPPLVGRSGSEKVRLEVLAGEEPPPGAGLRVKRAWTRLHARLLTPLGAAVGLAASVATLGGVFVALTAGGASPPGRMGGEAQRGGCRVYDQRAHDRGRCCSRPRCRTGAELRAPAPRPLAASRSAWPRECRSRHWRDQHVSVTVGRAACAGDRRRHRCVWRTRGRPSEHTAAAGFLSEPCRAAFGGRSRRRVRLRGSDHAAIRPCCQPPSSSTSPGRAHPTHGSLRASLHRSGVLPAPLPSPRGARFALRATPRAQPGRSCANTAAARQHRRSAGPCRRCSPRLLAGQQRRRYAYARRAWHGRRRLRGRARALPSRTDLIFSPRFSAARLCDCAS